MVNCCIHIYAGDTLVNPSFFSVSASFKVGKKNTCHGDVARPEADIHIFPPFSDTLGFPSLFNMFIIYLLNTREYKERKYDTRTKYERLLKNVIIR